MLSEKKSIDLSLEGAVTIWLKESVVVRYTFPGVVTFNGMGARVVVIR